MTWLGGDDGEDTVADEHYLALSWSGGLSHDEDGCPLSPPSNDPSMSGGLDAWFARTTQVSQYRCKFCRSLIGFLDRKPRNLFDGSPHRCLADAAAARRKVVEAAGVANG